MPNELGSIWTYFFKNHLVQKDWKKFGTAKIGHSEVFETILVEKVSGLHQTNRISIAVAETAIAIAIA